MQKILDMCISTLHSQEIPQHNEGETMMWDIGKNNFCSFRSFNVLNVINLALGKPPIEVVLLVR